MDEDFSEYGEQDAISCANGDFNTFEENQVFLDHEGDERDCGCDCDDPDCPEDDCDCACHCDRDHRDDPEDRYLDSMWEDRFEMGDF